MTSLAWAGPEVRPQHETPRRVVAAATPFKGGRAILHNTTHLHGKNPNLNFVSRFYTKTKEKNIPRHLLSRIYSTNSVGRRFLGYLQTKIK